MVRVPNAGSGPREREALIRKLERDLARFRRIPAWRRDAECADEGEATCRALLAELYEKKRRPERRWAIVNTTCWCAGRPECSKDCNINP